MLAVLNSINVKVNSLCFLPVFNRPLAEGADLCFVLPVNICYVLLVRFVGVYNFSTFVSIPVHVVAVCLL